MNRIFLRIISTIILLTVLYSCEKETDFDPRFPSDEFISDGLYEGEYWPTVEWRTCSPEQAGMSSEDLKKMNEEITLLLKLHIDVHGVLVIRKGYIVAEQYYSDDFTRDSLHRIYSCTKSITSAAIGIAIDEGYIKNADQAVLESSQKHIRMKYIPDYYYGYHWWVHPDGRYSAVGFAGQWIFVIPEHDLVVVFTNNLDESDSWQLSAPERLLETYIIPAVKD